MGNFLSVAVILVLLFGCEFKIAYRFDGQPHELVLNPPSNGGKQ